MKSALPKIGLGQEKGFTLIELIMVIVLLGILAAVAIPKYQDLRTEAAEAACDGVYGAVQGAAAVNFATRLVSPSMTSMINSGTDLFAALQGGAPAGWTTNGGAAVTDVLYMDFGARHCSIELTTDETVTAVATFTKTFGP